MAEMRPDRKGSFSKHRQGFSLISLVKKKVLARVVDPINIPVWPSADGKHTSNKVKEKQTLVRSHVFPRDVADLQAKCPLRPDL